MKNKNGYGFVSGIRKRQLRYQLIVIGLIIAIAGMLMLSMTYGNTVYSLETVYKVLRGEQIQGASFAIRTLRLPRTLAALICGIGFGISGNTFQKLLGNSLASPDIIGVTSGASVAAVFGILFLKLSRFQVSAMAVITSVVVAILIYVIAGGKKYSSGRLILTGIGFQAFLNAIVSWMLLKASQYDVGSALRWLSGSLNAVTMEDIPAVAIVLVAGCIVLLLLRPGLEILQLGEAHAITLGVPVNATRVGLIVSAILITSFATCVTGPIASVAFLSGPIASRLTKSGGVNFVTSGLVGALLVLVADFVAQYGFGVKYPVGVITGILGAPYLLLLLFRINKRGENV